LKKTEKKKKDEKVTADENIVLDDIPQGKVATKTEVTVKPSKPANR